jgi:hypothetical protein
MSRVFNIVMRVFSTLLGGLVSFVGLVWIGQGLGIGPAAIMQGFMVRNPQWAIYGAVAVVLGVAQIVWSNTRQRPNAGG